MQMKVKKSNTAIKARFASLMQSYTF